MNILKQLNVFFSGDTLHHHATCALPIQYPINQMIHLGFVHDMLNFDVVVRWWLIVQEHFDRAHLIVC
jgi:hypothetical protein